MIFTNANDLFTTRGQSLAEEYARQAREKRPAAATEACKALADLRRSYSAHLAAYWCGKAPEGQQEAQKQAFGTYCDMVLAVIKAGAAAVPLFDYAMYSSAQLDRLPVPVPYSSKWAAERQRLGAIMGESDSPHKFYKGEAGTK